MEGELADAVAAASVVKLQITGFLFASTWMLKPGLLMLLLLESLSEAKLKWQPNGTVSL